MRLLMFVLLALTSVCPWNCYAKGICDDPKITPGGALGVLRLGMSIDEAVELVGKPDLDEQSGKFGDSEWRRLYYYPASDFAIVVRDGKIVELSLGSGTQDAQRCSTSAGIRVGTRKVKKAYGDPDEKPDSRSSGALWVYDSRGIDFMVSAQGEVLAIDVFKPGGHSSLREREKALGW